MQAVRVLRSAMPRGSRSGTISILQAAAIDDTRMGASALRMLVTLGSYADTNGWCWPKQKTLADRLGITQQAVSKALRRLHELGYIEIHEQHDHETGARVASKYQIIRDFVLPVEFRRTPQPDVVGSQLEVVGAGQKVVTPTTSEVAGVTTSEVVAIEERPNRTTQLNDPIDIPGVGPEQDLFAYYRSKIFPTARVFKPEKIRARLKRFTLAELKAGIDNFSADSWWMENNAERGADWFFHSDQRSEQFLNLKPRPSQSRSNGTATIPPGAASKQMSSWANFKGRHGGNVGGKAL